MLNIHHELFLALGLSLLAISIIMIKDVISLKAKSLVFMTLSLFLVSLYGFLNFFALKIYFANKELSILLVRISLLFSGFGILFMYLGTVLMRRLHISVKDLPFIFFLSWFAIERCISASSMFFVEDGVVYRDMAGTHGSQLLSSVAILIGFLIISLNMIYNLNLAKNKINKSPWLYISMGTVAGASMGIVLVNLVYIFTPDYVSLNVMNLIIIISIVLYIGIVIKHPEFAYLLLQNTYFIYAMTRSGIEIVSIVSDKFDKQKLNQVLRILNIVKIDINKNIPNDLIMIKISNLSVIINISENFIILIGTDNPLDIHFESLSVLSKKLERIFHHGIVIISKDTKKLIKRIILPDFRCLLGPGYSTEK